MFSGFRGTIALIMVLGMLSLAACSGRSEGGSNETQHDVTLTTGFYMGKYQVTQELYTSVMGSNPSYFTGVPVEGDTTDRSTPQGETQGKRPVEMVTWYDAAEFCNKLSARDGLQAVYAITGRVPDTGYPITGAEVAADWGKNGYRLPTEAEWEYACRAGKGTAFNDGTATYTATGDYDAIVAPLGWYTANSGNTALTGAEYSASRKTHEVGKKAANAWGLHDMHGNVREWCWDIYGAYDTGAVTDPEGQPTGVFRVERGECYAGGAGALRSAVRSNRPPGYRIYYVGFRVVRASP
jgi:formylglycine-generating enzyme required for sulfatase activity